MSIKELTASQAREKHQAKAAELTKVFDEAKTDDGGNFDFSQVKCLGAQVKGNRAVADYIKATNAELDELIEHAEAMEEASKAASHHADRGKAFRRPPMPGGGDDQKGRGFGQIKSLGERVIEEKDYQAWRANGASGQINLNYEDLLPSDMLAKAGAFPTLGSKALMARSAGYAPEVVRAAGFVEMATRPIQVLDILPFFTTDQSAYKYMEQTTRTHGAAETAEGGTYAESTFVFTERNSPVQKITDSLPVTDEQLQDAPAMNGFIDTSLNFGVRQRLDGQIVVGDGSDPNLRGLKNLAGIQTQAKGADPSVEAFLRAMTKVRVIGRANPTHHLAHPTDWMNIRLTRTSDGIYIFGPPTEAGPERLWGLPVVQQDADVQGRAYTGSFQPPYCGLFERMGVTIEIGLVGTQFAEGKRTVRATIRVALVWGRPAAFCEITGLPA